MARKKSTPHIDHIGIYVRIGIECPEGEIVVPEQEHIAIADRIYDGLREQVTSDDYEGAVAGPLLNPDIMVETITPSGEVVSKVVMQVAEQLDKGEPGGLRGLLSRVPTTVLEAYLNGEYN